MHLPNKRAIRERALALFSRPYRDPVLVFGHLKSGTSAIAELLAAATGKRLFSDMAGAQEPCIGRLLRGELSMRDFVRQNAWAFSFPIVKEPNLTWVAHALMDQLGVERAVFIVRSPWQNLRSILDRLGMRGDLEVPVQDEPRRISRRARRLFSGGDLGIEGETYIDILAQRWFRTADMYRKRPERFVLVRYEDFNSAKQDSIASLAAALALPMQHDISHLLEKPFQPRGKPETDVAHFFGNNLARITAACGPLAMTFGYEPPAPEPRENAIVHPGTPDA